MSKEKKSLLEAIAATKRIVDVGKELAVEEKRRQAPTDLEQKEQSNQTDEQSPNK